MKWICYSLLLLVFLSTPGFAQTAKKKGGVQFPSQLHVGEKMFEEGSAQKRKSTHQRHAADVGMAELISKIPGKSYPILIETYSKDEESITLRDEIKTYLKNKGYTNIKIVAQAYFEKGFKYKECSIGIFDNPQAFDIFIAPCYK
jgi:hypothetical protein